MKRIAMVLGLGLLMVGATSCGQSDSEKLTTVFADYACDMHALLEEAKANPDKVSEVMKGRSEVNKKLDNAMKSNFGSEEKVEQAYEAMGQEAYAKGVREKAVKKCNPPEEILESAVNELQ